MNKYLVAIAMVVGFIVYNMGGFEGAAGSKSQEFVNFRPQIAMGIVEAVLSNPVKDMEEGEEEVALCDGSGYIVQGDGHRTVCPGCIACQGDGAANGEKVELEANLCDCKNSGVCLCGDDCDCDGCPKHNNLDSAQPENLEKPPLPIEDELDKELAEFEAEKKSKVKVQVGNPNRGVVVEVDNYHPQWNVNGDMSKALNRSELMYHLKRDHSISEPWMMSQSTDSLQRLHDSLHNQQRGLIRRTNSRVIINSGTSNWPTSGCPDGGCPTPVRSTRFRWFR